MKYLKLAGFSRQHLIEKRLLDYNELNFGKAAW
jgi:hypothetical protein